MSLRLEMLQVARLAPRLLRDASSLVRDFVLSHLRDDGGFHGRSPESDLYYTVFGLEGLLALQEPLPVESATRFVRAQLATMDELDLVHLACLARCDAALGGEALDGGERRAIADRIEAFASQDGGWAVERGRATGTLYGAFVALGAYQDTAGDAASGRLPDAGRVAAFLRARETPDGAYSNEPGAPIGSTTATAAALTVARTYGLPVTPGVRDWLFARWNARGGGFYAVPRAPLPDLLSTATAIHALASLEESLEPIREDCLDFIDSLWTNRGGFFGHWADQEPDCEYTFYGLLALGHLAL